MKRRVKVSPTMQKAKFAFWFRGADTKEDTNAATKQYGTYWTTSRHFAVSSAKKHKEGKLTRMNLRLDLLKAKDVIYGSLPDVAEELGIFKQWQELEMADKFHESAGLIESILRKRGIKVRVIDKEQIHILDPSIIQIVGTREVEKGTRRLLPEVKTIQRKSSITKPTKLPFTGRPSITPKRPRIT